MKTDNCLEQGEVNVDPVPDNISHHIFDTPDIRYIYSK